MATTILFVEDNADTRRALKRLIQSYGWNVVDFPDAEQALAGLPAGEIDLALLDVRLPGMWGDELARRLHGIRPNTPVAFVTAEPSSTGDSLRQERPGTTVIHKPIPVERFHHLLAQAMLNWHN